MPPWNCPNCGRAATGNNQTYEYCVYCQGYTGVNPPPYERYVKCIGGVADNYWPYEELRFLNVGDERTVWTIDHKAGVYRYDGTNYQYVRPG